MIKPVLGRVALISTAGFMDRDYMRAAMHDSIMRGELPVMFEAYDTPAPADIEVLAVYVDHAFMMEAEERIACRWRPAIDLRRLADPSLHDVPPSRPFDGAIAPGYDYLRPPPVFRPSRVRPNAFA